MPVEVPKRRLAGLWRSWSGAIVALLLSLGLGVFALVWLLGPFLFAPDPDYPQSQCASNLKNLGGFLVEMMTSHRWPQRQGPAFILQLSTRGMIRPEDVRVFTCPHDPEHARVDDPEFKDRYRGIDLKNPEPGLTSYAVRDFERFPFAFSESGKEPWALCPWHKEGIPVLYDDGSVVFHRREDLGLRPGESLVLGPDAKSELLRKFLPLQR